MRTLSIVPALGITLIVIGVLLSAVQLADGMLQARVAEQALGFALEPAAEVCEVSAAGTDGDQEESGRLSAVLSLMGAENRLSRIAGFEGSWNDGAAC